MPARNIRIIQRLTKQATDKGDLAFNLCLKVPLCLAEHFLQFRQRFVRILVALALQHDIAFCIDNRQAGNPWPEQSLLNRQRPSD